MIHTVATRILTRNPDAHTSHLYLPRFSTGEEGMEDGDGEDLQSK